MFRTARRTRRLALIGVAPLLVGGLMAGQFSSPASSAVALPATVTSGLAAASQLPRPGHIVPFSGFPTDYSKLPDVSWVIPNLCNDMHNCDVATGDSWLQQNLAGYASWAQANNSLLIITFDEDDHSMNNQIPTIFYGGDAVPGDYSENITHYSVLRTIESMYGLSHLKLAKQANTISDVWK